MTSVTELALLESLSRETHNPLDTVLAMYQREHDALAREARITSYLPLLAARIVRQQLLHATPGDRPLMTSR
jgi:hypothetical protein